MLFGSLFGRFKLSLSSLIRLSTVQRFLDSSWDLGFVVRNSLASETSPGVWFRLLLLATSAAAAFEASEAIGLNSILVPWIFSLSFPKPPTLKFSSPIFILLMPELYFRLLFRLLWTLSLINFMNFSLFSGLICSNS